MLYDFIYISYLNSKIIEIERRMVVVKGWEKWEAVSWIEIQFC